MLSPKHFYKPGLPAVFPIPDVNSVWHKPQTLKLFLIPFSVSQPISIPQKIPLALCIRDLTTSHRLHCYHFFTGLLYMAFIDFPMLLLFPTSLIKEAE